MLTSPGWLLLVAGLLILVAGLVAMAETALDDVSRSRADELVQQERRGAVTLRKLVDHGAPVLSASLLLRVAAEIVAVVLVTIACEQWLSSLWLAVVVAAGAMIVISYVVVGVAPRTVGRRHAEGVALAMAGSLRTLTRVLSPLSATLNVVADAITPGKVSRDGPFTTEAELREMVDYAEAGRIIESDERKMIHKVFDLGDTLVREVMVPRTDVVFIEGTKNLRQFQSLALRSGFSRIPVVGQGGLDDVVGIAYLKDVAKRLFDNRDAESVEKTSAMARKNPMFVPDSKPADDLLREMQAKRIHIAIVLDEYGGTAGLVTIEDILEEIVGEITDEYDIEKVQPEDLGDGTVRVSARMHVDALGEYLGIELSDADVDTVGGLMAKHLGRVPIPGAEVEMGGLQLQAEGVAGRRNQIGTVRVRRAAVPDDERDDDSDEYASDA